MIYKIIIFSNKSKLFLKFGSPGITWSSYQIDILQLNLSFKINRVDLFKILLCPSKIKSGL